MPTGYTAKLMDKGQSFPEFAMLCARAFGACITMRDDDMDAAIPDSFEPSDYYVKSQAEHERRLADLMAMTPEQRLGHGELLRGESISRTKEYIVKEQVENARLLEMEAEVAKWKPPTKDHDGMKKFMLEQISISKNGSSYWAKELLNAEQKLPQEYWQDAVETATRGIAYAKEEMAKEIERAHGRTEWVRALRASLTPCS